MPHRNANVKPRKTLSPKSDSRYTVGLAPGVAQKVEKYAKATDTSISKAIAALVRIGLEGQEIRKREFFKKLRENLASESPAQEDVLVDEFRSLVLGR